MQGARRLAPCSRHTPSRRTTPRALSEGVRRQRDPHGLIRTASCLEIQPRSFILTALSSQLPHCAPCFRRAPGRAPGPSTPMSLGAPKRARLAVYSHLHGSTRLYIQYTHGCIRLYWGLSRVEIGAHLVGPPAPVHPRRQVVHHHHRPLLPPRPPLQPAATPPRQRLRGRPGPGGGRAGIGPGGGQDGAVADVGGGLDRVVTAVTGP